MCALVGVSYIYSCVGGMVVVSLHLGKLNIPIGLWPVAHHYRERPRYYRVFDALNCQVRFCELVVTVLWKQQNNTE